LGSGQGADLGYWRGRLGFTMNSNYDFWCYLFFRKRGKNEKNDIEFVTPRIKIHRKSCTFKKLLAT